MTQARIGLFYGSSTCYTEMVAEKIAAALGESTLDIHNIAEVPVSLMAAYDRLILGIPTWDYGELQEDWEDCWDDLCRQNGGTVWSGRPDRLPGVVPRRTGVSLGKSLLAGRNHRGLLADGGISIRRFEGADCRRQTLRRAGN